MSGAGAWRSCLFHSQFSGGIVFFGGGGAWWLDRDNVGTGDSPLPARPPTRPPTLLLLPTFYSANDYLGPLTAGNPLISDTAAVCTMRFSKLVAFHPANSKL